MKVVIVLHYGKCRIKCYILGTCSTSRPKMHQFWLILFVAIHQMLWKCSTKLLECSFNWQHNLLLHFLLGWIHFVIFSAIDWKSEISFELKTDCIIYNSQYATGGQYMYLHFNTVGQLLRLACISKSDLCLKFFRRFQNSKIKWSHWYFCFKVLTQKFIRGSWVQLCLNKDEPLISWP